jgi:hypothetical protein
MRTARPGGGEPGIDKTGSDNSTSSAPAAATQVRFLAARLHRLGPRPLCEYLTEVIAGADPLVRLRKYADIDVGILDAHGGRELHHCLRLAGEQP